MKTADGRIEKKICSNRRVKSKPFRQSTTTGPKVPSEEQVWLRVAVTDILSRYVMDG